MIVVDREYLEYSIDQVGQATMFRVLVDDGLESLLISLMAGGVAALASLSVDGMAMNIPMGVFRFSVEPWMLTGGLGLAALIAILASAIPAWKLLTLRPAQTIAGR